MKIAVVGAGIAGLVSAYMLCSKHKVYVYEKSNRPGGGIFSIKYKEDNKECFIDIGFTIYNRAYYPNLVNLLDQLHIRDQEVPKQIVFNCPHRKSCWQLGDKTQFISSTTAYLKPINYKVSNVWRGFRKQWKTFLEKKDTKISLSEYLAEEKISSEIQTRFILPLVQSFWTGLKSDLKEMPAYYFFSFLNKIGLLEDNEHTQWRTIRGGAFRIVSQIVSGLINPIRFQTEIKKIYRHPDYVEITTQTGEKETFDAVIIAIPADDALKILTKPTPSEEQILSSFGYDEFNIVVHNDERFVQVPIKEASSWYIQASESPAKIPPVVSWDLNHLQQLPIKTKIFLTFAPYENNVPKEKTMFVFRRKASKPTWKKLSVQKRFTEISGMNRTYYCGDYWGEGTIEDSLGSALQVVQMLGKEERRI